MKEHDRVVLESDIQERGLKAGDVGTVVHVYGKGEAYEIELVSLNGKTVAVVTVEAQQVRPVREREITHARTLKAV